MQADIVIIGSGMGGSAIAWALADAGVSVLVLERGQHFPREAKNRDAEAMFIEQHYRTTEHWLNAEGNTFRPGQYYYVGGCSKVYGGAMFRLREKDFESVEHEEGVSPAWPIQYRDLAPYYDLAERLFQVHGQLDADPTEPPHLTEYPYPPQPHEPYMAELAKRLSVQGIHPFPLPSAVQFHGGTCRRCGSCDGFPCEWDARQDAELALLKPALAKTNVKLVANAHVLNLMTDAQGKRIVSAHAEINGKPTRIDGKVFVLSAGAINSAALLLASANSVCPQGLANSSGAVGRYFMNHNCTAVLGIHPTRVHQSQNPKTLAINDFYFGGKASSWPLGNLQTLGKIREPMLRQALHWLPHRIRNFIAMHSVDWYAMSEDLPHPDSRVTLTPRGQIRLSWRRTNLKPHRQLVRVAKKMLRDAGYPLVVSRPFSVDAPSHQCGTVRFGNTPEVAPLDPYCKAYDHENLFVVDGSFFPSSAAVNPSLTIVAQGLRVGAQIKNNLEKYCHA